jgi:hypothetical protein
MVILFQFLKNHHTAFCNCYAIYRPTASSFSTSSPTFIISLVLRQALTVLPRVLLYSWLKWFSCLSLLSSWDYTTGLCHCFWLVIFWGIFFFDNSHPNRYEMVTNCGFGLHSPKAEWCWTYFHVPVGYLYIFGECLITSFVHFWIKLLLFLSSRGLFEDR